MKKLALRLMIANAVVAAVAGIMSVLCFIFGNPFLGVINVILVIFNIFMFSGNLRAYDDATD